MQTPQSPAPEPASKELEKQSLSFQRFGFPMLKGLAWLFMMILGPYKRRGQYRVPKSGGVLVLSNHQADVDPIAVQLACPRPVYFMAKSELWDMKFVSYFLNLVH